MEEFQEAMNMGEKAKKQQRKMDKYATRREERAADGLKLQRRFDGNNPLRFKIKVSKKQKENGPSVMDKHVFGKDLPETQKKISKIVKEDIKYNKARAKYEIANNKRNRYFLDDPESKEKIDKEIESLEAWKATEAQRLRQPHPVKVSRKNIYRPYNPNELNIRQEAPPQPRVIPPPAPKVATRPPLPRPKGKRTTTRQRMGRL